MSVLAVCWTITIVLVLTEYLYDRYKHRRDKEAKEGLEKMKQGFRR